MNHFLDFLKAMAKAVYLSAIITVVAAAFSLCCLPGFVFFCVYGKWTWAAGSLALGASPWIMLILASYAIDAIELAKAKLATWRGKLQKPACFARGGRRCSSSL